MAVLTKSPPWEAYYKELCAIFDADPDIDVMKKYSDEKDRKIIVYVRNDRKYMVLQKHMPHTVTFGNVDIKIELVPANTVQPTSRQEDMRTLFANNGNVSRIVKKDLPGGGEVTYIAFKNGVAQFFDDNLADVNGNQTILLENAVRKIFGSIEEVYFCTDEPVKPAAKPISLSDLKQQYYSGTKSIDDYPF